MTTEELTVQLAELDQGVLYHGSHKVGTKEFCVLEFRHAVLHHDHSDTPLDFLDLRPLNDAPWSSNTLRTTHVLPVLAALWDWPAWSLERQQQWASQVTISTVQQIIAELPQLPDAVRLQCRNVITVVEAADAALDELLY